MVATSWVVLGIGVSGCGEASPPTVSGQAAQAPAATARSTSSAAVGSGSPDPAAATVTRARPSSRRAADSPSLARMLGQMIVARFAGLHPSGALLARVRAGQIGGVILFADNVAGGEGPTRTLIGQLQHAAAAGGDPPLLVMTDQEGGTVRRLSWAPPALAASAMSSDGIARVEGEAAGRALRSVGVNLDLAPVADVLGVSSGSFLGTRSFGSNPAIVASRACAFAGGLTTAGVGFTLKHFPGLGRALADTDTQPVTVEVSANALRADYQAYRRCGSQPSALVMVSSAAYPSLTGTSLPAVLSPEVYREELPYATGGAEPLTISDDLQTPAIVDQVHPAQQAIDAGLDLLMYAQTEAGSAVAYTQLLAVARAHGITRARLQEAYQAIQGFKQLLTGQATAAALPGNTAESGESDGGQGGYTPAAPPAYVGTPTTINPDTHSSG